MARHGAAAVYLMVSTMWDARAAVLSSFQRITSVCSTCSQGPNSFKPAPGASELFHNPDFCNGEEFWSCYTDGCTDCPSHVHGFVDTATEEYTISFSDMGAVPQAKTQFWASNISIADKAYYNVSFRIKATHDVTISHIAMTSMESPWPSYSAPSHSIPVQETASTDGGWQTSSVLLGPTSTYANDTRVTWWFQSNGKPNDVNVTFTSMSLFQVVPLHPGHTQADTLRVMGAGMANSTAASVEECATACMANRACISFNYVGTLCELNQYSEGYTVVMEPRSQYWLRLESPQQASAASTAIQHAVPYQLAVPTGNVTLTSGTRRRDAVFDHSMQVSIDYLLRNYNVDNMLWWFRFRAGDPNPPGHPQGWDQCDNNLRAKHMCLKGTVASTFLMGAGGILRWPMACCTNGTGSCCASRTELRRRFEQVLAGIYNATQVNGFAAAFAENETMYRENPDYVLSWLTHGLLEADIAQADGSGRAIQISRGMIDWFSNVSKNWLLPEFMPPDRTVAADVPPVYGANTGHQIYLISQGIIHHSRMATSALGRQRDVDVITELYQEDEWLSGLATKNDSAIWQKHWFPHNYEVTAFEAYFDMYTMTGNTTYLTAIQGAWEMFMESFLHVGGAMALNEGSHGADLNSGLWYPPKSYYLEGDSSTGFQKQENPHISGETCGSVFWVKLNQRFHRTFPTDERYVAEIERSLLNIGVANQATKVGDPLAGVRSFALLHGHKNKIQNISTCEASQVDPSKLCLKDFHWLYRGCEGQGTRLHGSLPEYLFSPYTSHHGSGIAGISIDIFAAATFQFGETKLQINSNFPYPQPPNTPINIKLTTSRSVEMELALRIPSWLATPTATVLLNGAPHATPRKGSFLKIKRLWHSGDSISLFLPMGFRATEYVGKNQIAGHRRVAYEYGPTLLAAVPGDATSWTNGSNAAASCLFLRGVDGTAPDEWLIPSSANDMRFRVPVGAVKGGGTVTFVPYFEIADELMTVYPAYDL